MNKSHLVSCAGCARHVRASEAVCPFCRSELPQALRESLPRRPPPARLTRAALFAIGTGAATIATACGGNVESGGTSQPAYGGSQMVDGGGMGEPAYGGGSHPFDSGAGDSAADTGTAVLYGGIFPEDASVGALDASTGDDGGAESSARRVAAAGYGNSSPLWATPHSATATARRELGHFARERRDELGRGHRPRERGALPSPLRAEARFPGSLAGSVECLSRVIGDRIIGNVAARNPSS